MTRTAFITAPLVAALVAGALAAGALPAGAATAPPDTDTFSINVSLGDLSGAATTADAAVVAMPANCKILDISASAASSSGTSPTLTVDVELGTTDIIADPITVVAATPASAASVTDDDIAAGGVLHFDAVVGGTTPVFNEVQATIFCARY